ncbi:hypothetical protein [Thermostaphylospora chromogena]|uniref:Uncharacterized protein n=1 Tax=Thermostaphylospora chromogena TaxID=35622 RepID=A0A1H1CKE6_9ACTN|nr:hypothetical protein [Thermostaphylospora chromogena]SDQ64647.1 hypothetical protein SAMN04489764_1521 [Thermostaphylospora chromogena]
MTFEFTLARRALRGREKRDLFTVLTGTAGPYGAATVSVGTVSRRAELSCPALPEAWVDHPDTTRQGLIAVDERTRLVVGGRPASLTQNRRARSREDRALRITLDDRRYAYLATGTGAEELRDAARGPLVRIRIPLRGDRTVTVLPAADAVDVALALVLQGADMRALTLTRAALIGALSFLDTGKGEA